MKKVKKVKKAKKMKKVKKMKKMKKMKKICLLYTSDAADEEDSVDLGGRRIIKNFFKDVFTFIQKWVRPQNYEAMKKHRQRQNITSHHSLSLL